MNKILVTLLFLASSNTFAEIVKVTSSESSITIDTEALRTCSTTAVEKYTRYSLYKNMQSIYHLITQNFETGVGCFEGNNPQSLTVSANILDVTTGKINSSPVWSFQAQAVSGEVEYPFHNLYKTESPGCCASVATSKYYSLETGKLVSSTTTDLRSIIDTKSNTRIFIGVESNTASLPEKSTGSIATIIIGNENGKFQETSIRSKKYSEEDWDVKSLNFVLSKESQKFNANPATYAVGNKEKVKDVSLNLILTCRCESEPVNILLKMGENALDVSASTVDKTEDISLK